MKTVIPDYVDVFLRDKVSCGDYRPISDETGPQNGNEWLALIEDEAAVQGDNATHYEAEEKQVFLHFQKDLEEIAQSLRQEGFTPIKFHWQE